jgi:hypothetical protein
LMVSAAASSAIIAAWASRPVPAQAWQRIAGHCLQTPGM